MIRWSILFLLWSAQLWILCPQDCSAFAESSRMAAKPTRSSWTPTVTSSPQRLALRLSKNDDEEDEGLAKKGLVFGLSNFWSVADAIIWSSLTVTIILYFLGYTFEIDRQDGFHFNVRVDTIEQVRSEKQLDAAYPKGK